MNLNDEQREQAPERIWTVGGSEGRFFLERGNFATVGYVREDLLDDAAQSLINEAKTVGKLMEATATTMRDACVGTLRGLRHKSEPDDSRWNVALYHAEKQIESLTLDQVQEKR